jgi:tRNA A-37 threonylcarbamoyl transferase component Bud32
MNRPTAPDPGRERNEEELGRAFASFVAAMQRGEAPDPSAIAVPPELQGALQDLARLAREIGAPWLRQPPVLPGYRLIRPIGDGSSGVVWLAMQERLQREVAIKVLRTAALEPDALDRCRREAQVLARFRDPRVVVVHDVVECEDAVAITMDFVPGPSLRALCRALRDAADRPPAAVAAALVGGAARFEPFAQWVVQQGIRLAGALAELHEAGLVHRDVKPENVLLTAGGETILVDLGLALSDPRTGAPGFVGTRAYAAPEQLVAAGAVDGRADTYSLALVLVELLTGSAPTAGEAPLLGRRRGIGRDLSAVFERALEPDPVRRYATARDFAEDLERALLMQPVRALPNGVARRFAHALRRHRGALATISIGLAALFAAVLGVATWLRAAYEAPQRARNLQLDAQALVLGTLVLGRDADDERAAILRRAVADYDASLAVAADPAVRRERQVVTLAADLLDARTGAYSSTLADAIESSVAREAQALPAEVRAACRDWLRGRRIPAPRSATLDGELHFQLGLLAFALGDTAYEGHGWTGIGPLRDQAPLVDAGVGLMLHASGEHGLALPRLLRGATSYPDSALLAVRLADTALALGDAELSATVLERIGPVPPPLAPEREATAAGLLASRGETARAARRFAELWTADGPPGISERYAELLLHSGDAAAAVRILRGALARHPDQPSLRLAAAKTCLAAGEVGPYLRLAIDAWRRLSGIPAGARPPQLRRVLELGGVPSPGDPLPSTSVVQTRRGDPPTIATTIAARADHEVLQQLAVRLAWLGTAAWPLSDAEDRGPIAVVSTASGALLAFPELAVERGPAGLAWLAASALAHGYRVGLCRQAVPAAWLAIERLLAAPPAPPIAARAGATIVGVALFGGAASDGSWAGGALVGRLTGEDAGAVRLVYATPLGGAMRAALELLRCDPSGAVIDARGLDPQSWILASSAAPLGDADGDGVADVAIGVAITAASVDPGSPTPRSFVEARGRGGAPLWRIESADVGRFPWSLAGLGEVDGEGRLAIGWPAALQPLRGGDDVEIVSTRSGERILRWSGPPQRTCGVALVGLPDLDGDGVPELAVGCPHRRSGPGSVVVLRGADATVLAEVLGPGDRPAFGSVLALAPDIDGDGWPELAVSDSRPAWVASADRTTVWLVSAARRAVLWHRGASQARAHFGASLAPVPDADGDGLADLLVGAPSAGVGRRGEVALLSSADGALRSTWHGRSVGERLGLDLAPLPDAGPDQTGAIAAGIGETRGTLLLHALVRADGRPPSARLPRWTATFPR